MTSSSSSLGFADKQGFGMRMGILASALECKSFRHPWPFDSLPRCRDTSSLGRVLRLPCLLAFGSWQRRAKINLPTPSGLQAGYLKVASLGFVHWRPGSKPSPKPTNQTPKKSGIHGRFGFVFEGFRESEQVPNQRANLPPPPLQKKCGYWSKFPIIRGPIFGFPL